MYQMNTMPMYYQNQSSLIRVNGLEGAKAYQMGANSQVALFDNNDDIMYIKITDGAGFPTLRTFKFYEETPIRNQNISDEYVSKSDLEAFKQEVTDYVKQFIQQSTKSKLELETISTEHNEKQSKGLV